MLKTCYILPRPYVYICLSNKIKLSSAASPPHLQNINAQPISRTTILQAIPTTQERAIRQGRIRRARLQLVATVALDAILSAKVLVPGAKSSTLFERHIGSGFRRRRQGAAGCSLGIAGVEGIVTDGYGVRGRGIRIGCVVDGIDGQAVGATAGFVGSAAASHGAVGSRC